MRRASESAQRDVGDEMGQWLRDRRTFSDRFWSAHKEFLRKEPTVDGVDGLQDVLAKYVRHINESIGTGIPDPLAWAILQRLLADMDEMDGEETLVGATSGMPWGLAHVLDLVGARLEEYLAECRCPPPADPNIWTKWIADSIRSAHDRFLAREIVVGSVKEFRPLLVEYFQSLARSVFPSGLRRPWDIVCEILASVPGLPGGAEEACERACKNRAGLDEVLVMLRDQYEGFLTQLAASAPERG